MSMDSQNSQNSSNGNAEPVPNLAEIERFLHALNPQGGVLELRAFDAIELLAYKRKVTADSKEIEIPCWKVKNSNPAYQKHGPVTGYFEDYKVAARAAASLNLYGRSSVYVTLQAPKRDLLARAKNRLEFHGKGTEDADVETYRYLGIDLDPARPSKVMATDAEAGCAAELAVRITEYLADLDFPPPMQIGSGSGRWLIYALEELPASEQPLITSVLNSLSGLFSTDQCDLDITTGNPGRVCPVVGTVKMKGDHAPEVGRPWRLCQIVDLPGDLGVRKVTPAQLELLAASGPSPAGTDSGTKPNTAQSSSDKGPEKWLQWIAENHVPVGKRQDRPYGITFQIDCLERGDEHAGKAALTILNSGAVTARCLSSHCSWTWKDFRRRYERPADNARGTKHQGRREEHDVPPSTSDPRTNGTGSNEQPPASEWPDSLAPDAFHGPAGQFVELLSPHTESDPAGLLFTFLTCFGNVAGDASYFLAENDRHPPRLDCCLVGDTSKGRKGTSRGRVLRVFEAVDSQWVTANVKSGLSSGEGLIYHVRDPIETQKPVYEKKKVVGYETVIVDPGVTDKRMLVLEDEFASALKVLRREGNTLSPTLRRAWDSGSLHILTKNNPICATGAHVSLLGHITRQELLRHLTETEYANGFGNRFLWVLVRRARILPFGGNLLENAMAPIIDTVRMAIDFAGQGGSIRRDGDADQLWGEIYPHLSGAGAGLLGAITARAEAQTMRLALIYALLDQSPEIRLVHLQAGLAAWAYAYNSARHIFGLKTGDPVADKVLDALRVSDAGMTLTELHRKFSNNLNGERLSEALRMLEKEGFARQHVVSGEDEATELRWFAKV